MNCIHLFVFLIFPQAWIYSVKFLWGQKVGYTLPETLRNCFLIDFPYYVYFLPFSGGEGVLCCLESHGLHCVCDWDWPHLCSSSLVRVQRDVPFPLHLHLACDRVAASKNGPVNIHFNLEGPRSWERLLLTVRSRSSAQREQRWSEKLKFRIPMEIPSALT